MKVHSATSSLSNVSHSLPFPDKRVNKIKVLIFLQVPCKNDQLVYVKSYCTIYSFVSLFLLLVYLMLPNLDSWSLLKWRHLFLIPKYTWTMYWTCHLQSHNIMSKEINSVRYQIKTYQHNQFNISLTQSTSSKYIWPVSTSSSQYYHYVWHQSTRK